MAAKRRDIRIMDSGSIVIIDPMTRRAESWIDENIGRENGYQPHYPMIIVEHRFADAILEGMADDGLRW